MCHRILIESRSVYTSPLHRASTQGMHAPLHRASTQGMHAGASVGRSTTSSQPLCPPAIPLPPPPVLFDDLKVDDDLVRSRQMHSENHNSTCSKSRDKIKCPARFHWQIADNTWIMDGRTSARRRRLTMRRRHIGIKPSAGNLPTSNEFTCEHRAYHFIVLLCNDANDICCISLLLEIRRSFLFDQMRVDKLERNYGYILL